MTLEDQIKATAAQGEDLKARVATMTAALNAMDAVVSEMSERVEKLEQKNLTHKQFIDLFTPEEWGAWQNLIDGAVQTPVADRTALQTQQIASYRYFEKALGVDLAETVTIAGVMALRSWGVLGSDARVTAVLANEAP